MPTFFADRYEAVTRQFCFPEWMCCNAHLQLALIKKDKEKSLSILQKNVSCHEKKNGIRKITSYIVMQMAAVLHFFK